MTQIQDITTADWQISLSNLGDVVTDEQDIYQSIRIILSTRKGEVPLDPFFGSDVLNHMDKPIRKALPSIVASIIESIGLYEKRISITSVTYSTPFIGRITIEIKGVQVSTAKDLKYIFFINKQ